MMCGSLSAYRSWQEIRDWYGLTASEEIKSTDPQVTAVVRPTDLRPIIRLNAEDRLLDTAIWGFPGRKGRSRPVINARCETIDVLPMFKDAFATRRCVVPASGYYEWKRELDGSKSPFKFTLTADASELMAMAGLYMINRQTKQRHFVVVTTEANETAAAIHDRMPVILDDEGIGAWLSRGSDPEALRRLCQPYDGRALKVETVPTTLFDRPKPENKDQMSLAL